MCHSHTSYCAPMAVCSSPRRGPTSGFVKTGVGEQWRRVAQFLLTALFRSLPLIALMWCLYAVGTCWLSILMALLTFSGWELQMEEPKQSVAAVTPWAQRQMQTA